MTTANLMNVPSVKGNVPAQIDLSKKLQDENLEVAEIFAGLMNQTIEIPNSVVDDTSSNMDVSKTDSIQSPAGDYERYAYKEKQIDTAKEPSVEEKLEEAGDVLEQAGEEVIDTLTEAYGVDEETIQNLLDDMGLNPLDLLNPQNLISFIIQLTDVTSGEDLLLDENFLSVMETLNNLAEGLMKDLNVDMNGLQELVAQMELINTEVSNDFQTILNDVVNATDVLEMNGESKTEVEANVFSETAETGESTNDVVINENSNTTKQVDASETAKEVETVDATESAEIVEDDGAIETVVAKETPDSTETSEASDAKDVVKVTESRDVAKEFHSDRNSEGNTNGNTSAETLVNTQTTANVSQALSSQTVQSFSSYLSADTVQIMEQIVQQMRVTISNEITTMEMQMNPENLGKVYVNISSEEGVVNAQFQATNEVVKEALETQIATLRESLNQAGVKVDAIEVTIASHEFERNLEQNNQNPEENVNAQEANTSKRRNLNLESLDDLQGMMTEEEALVAQIMRDNGNSVDFTA